MLNLTVCPKDDVNSFDLLNFSWVVGWFGSSVPSWCWAAGLCHFMWILKRNWNDRLIVTFTHHQIQHTLAGPCFRLLLPISGQAPNLASLLLLHPQQVSLHRPCALKSRSSRHHQCQNGRMSTAIYIFKRYVQRMTSIIHYVHFFSLLCRLTDVPPFTDCIGYSCCIMASRKTKQKRGMEQGPAVFN